MLTLGLIILSVIVLIGATSLRILQVARVATQGVIFDLHYMTKPFIKDSYNVTSMMPEISTVVDCAAKLIQEGDRTVLVIMLLIARFIEGFIATISSQWIFGLAFFQLVVSAIFIYRRGESPPVGNIAPLEPSAELVELTFRAFDKTKISKILREQVEATHGIETRLVTVESAIDDLCSNFQSKCLISQQAQASQNLIQAQGQVPPKKVNLFNQSVQSQQLPQQAPPLSQRQQLDDRAKKFEALVPRKSAVRNWLGSAIEFARRVLCLKPVSAPKILDQVSRNVFRLNQASLISSQLH